jgi:hypothetical protein
VFSATLSTSLTTPAQPCYYVPTELLANHPSTISIPSKANSAESAPLHTQQKISQWKDPLLYFTFILSTPLGCQAMAWLPELR